MFYGFQADISLEIRALKEKSVGGTKSLAQFGGNFMTRQKSAAEFSLAKRHV